MLFYSEVSEDPRWPYRTIPSIKTSHTRPANIQTTCKQTEQPTPPVITPCPLSPFSQSPPYPNTRPGPLSNPPQNPPPYLQAIMLYLHPPYQLPHSNRISHVHAMPPRGIPDPQLGRPRILFRMPLESKNRIVVTQECLTPCDQLMEPLWRGPHLAAVVLLEADRA